MMLYTVPLLGTLSRVPRGEVTSEIARDPPHALDILASADWATVVDHSLIVAAPTGVNWMVDRAVANLIVLHQLHDLYDRTNVFLRFTIQLYIGNMPTKRECVEWSL